MRMLMRFAIDGILGRGGLSFDVVPIDEGSEGAAKTLTRIP